MTNSPPATLLARLLALCAIARATLPATAHAGAVGLEPRAGGLEELVYDARDGERNRLEVEYDSSARRWAVADAAGVTPGRGCSLPDPADATRAVCSVTATASGLAAVDLGDLDDEVALTGTGLSRSVIDGGTGDDVLGGGAGDDTFSQGSRPDGSDRIAGGGGTDTVDYSGRRRGVRADLGGDGGDGQSGEGDAIAADVEGLAGGRGRDRLRGNSSENTLVGGGGADRLAGGTGYDRIDGGPGSDGIRARDGSIDLVACGSGSDRARLDGLDFFTGGCEKVRRNRLSGATVLFVSYDSSGRLLVDVGCPADARVVPCVGRVAVSVEGRGLGERRVGLGGGESASMSFPLPSDVADRLRAGGRVSSKTVVRTHMGRIRRRVTVLWSLPLRS